MWNIIRLHIEENAQPKSACNLKVSPVSVSPVENQINIIRFNASNTVKVSIGCARGTCSSM